MPSTKITMLSLLCEAEIRVRKQGENAFYNYLLHNKPCFGMFFHSVLNSSRSTIFRDIDIDVYQYIDPLILSRYKMNNFCSLSPKQLEEYHRELEFVFAKTVDNKESGLKISTEITKRYFDWGHEFDNPIKLDAIKIHIEADKLVSYQLLVLLTLIRLSSEYPNALLLKECCNLQDAGYFKEFSKLSLFMLLSNKLMYAYDQGPMDYFDNRRSMCKPICLEYFQTRMTPFTEEYYQTNERVMKSFLIVSRGPKNQEAFKFSRFYGGGGDEAGKGKLYSTNEIIDKLLSGDIIPEHLEIFNQLRDMVYGQFPKLKVDHPEFKEVKK